MNTIDFDHQRDNETRAAVEIAYKVVPEYATGNYSCSGTIAKRWQAAFDAAHMALDSNNPFVLALVQGRQVSAVLSA